MTILEALDLVKKNLSNEIFEHSVQVAIYAESICNSIDYDKDTEDVSVVAILHDILEDALNDDTKIMIRPILDSELSTVQYQALNLLTRAKDEPYVDYIKRIKILSLSTEFGEIAYIVKMADMKDHLTRIETLTDELKEKYIKGLSLLI